jgi:hypothetical protein
MPKKSYAFETRYADSSNRNAPLLRMPSDNDWLLLANYSDKSLMRNFFTYHMYNKTGRWAPRMHFCDLMIDGEYQGVYLLGEKVKQDNQRLDIYSMLPSDTLFPNLTGGYIFRVDWVSWDDVTWKSDYPAVNATNNLMYILDYPKKEDLQNIQLKYINSYVDSFEYVMKQPQFADPVNGYRKYADEPSFIDFILINEFTKNVDGYRLSTYLHKDRNGKIYAGPPWDFDLTWGNANYMDCWLPSGWSYQVQMAYTDQCPFWWELFFDDTLFTNHMRCRWEELRQTVYNPQIIKHEIDSIVSMIDPSVDLNFIKWPILGIYVWPNPSPIPTTYEGEIQNLKDWVDMRIAWLDANLPGICDYTGVSENPRTISNVSPSVYPNPASQSFSIRNFEVKGPCSLELFTTNGSSVFSMKWDGRSAINLPAGLATGLYVIRLQDEEKSAIIKLSVRE